MSLMCRLPAIRLSSSGRRRGERLRQKTLLLRAFARTRDRLASLAKNAVLDATDYLLHLADAGVGPQHSQRDPFTKSHIWLAEPPQAFIVS